MKTHYENTYYASLKYSFFHFYETIYSQTYMLVVVSVAYGIDIWYRLSVLWGKEIISDAKETQHYSSLDAFPWLIA